MRNNRPWGSSTRFCCWQQQVLGELTSPGAPSPIWTTCLGPTSASQLSLWEDISCASIKCATPCCFMTAVLVNCSVYVFFCVCDNSHCRWEKRIKTKMGSWTSWLFNCSYPWNLRSRCTASSCCSPSATSSLYVLHWLLASFVYSTHSHCAVYQF